MLLHASWRSSAAFPSDITRRVGVEADAGPDANTQGSSEPAEQAATERICWRDNAKSHCSDHPSEPPAHVVPGTLPRPG